MSTTPAGLGVLAVDVAAGLCASGILATTSVDEDGGIEVVVQLDPHRGLVAAMGAGAWAQAVVHTPGEPDRVVFDVLGEDACVEHQGCVSLSIWGWVVRHRGTTW